VKWAKLSWLGAVIAIWLVVQPSAGVADGRVERIEPRSESFEHGAAERGPTHAGPPLRRTKPALRRIEVDRSPPAKPARKVARNIDRPRDPSQRPKFERDKMRAPHGRFAVDDRIRVGIEGRESEHSGQVSDWRPGVVSPRVPSIASLEGKAPPPRSTTLEPARDRTKRPTPRPNRTPRAKTSVSACRCARFQSVHELFAKHDLDARCYETCRRDIEQRSSSEIRTQ
jgi:hypothetical protein